MLKWPYCTSHYCLQSCCHQLSYYLMNCTHQTYWSLIWHAFYTLLLGLGQMKVELMLLTNLLLKPFGPSVLSSLQLRTIHLISLSISCGSSYIIIIKASELHHTQRAGLYLHVSLNIFIKITKFLFHYLQVFCHIALHSSSGCQNS